MFAYQVVPLLENVDVLLHLAMFRPPFKALERAEAFLEEKSELVEHLLKIGLQTEPVFAQSKNPNSFSRLFIFQSNIPRWDKLFGSGVGTHQPGWHFSEITEELKGEHPLAINLVLPFLLSGPQPHRFIDLQFLQTANESLDLGGVEISEAG